MEDIRTVRTVRRQTGQAARCGRNKAQSFKERTTRNGGYGFLNHTFQPFWLFDGDSEKAEDGFFRSLAHLCQHYDLLLPDVSELSFPQNVYRAWQVVSERIEAIDNKLDCVILQDDTHAATLATISRYDTGRTLYYIPFKPLWKWVNDSEQQAAANVVLAIFSYLYQVVQIPSYTDPYTFLGGQYRYVEDWINEEAYEDEDDETKGYREEQLGELYQMQNSGLHLQRLMEDKARLENFADTVLTYANAEVRDNDLAILAIEFVQLYQAYPNRSYLDAIRPDLYYPELDERIKAEEYVSFYWSGNDSVIETVMDMINCSFQEMSITDEPVEVTLFDHEQPAHAPSFGFESRFFPLLNKLAEFLDDYDH